MNTENQKEKDAVVAKGTKLQSTAVAKKREEKTVAVANVQESPTVATPRVSQQSEPANPNVQEPSTVATPRVSEQPEPAMPNVDTEGLQSGKFSQKTLSNMGISDRTLPSALMENRGAIPQVEALKESISDDNTISEQHTNT